MQINKGWHRAKRMIFSLAWCVCGGLVVSGLLRPTVVQAASPPIPEEQKRADLQEFLDYLNSAAVIKQAATKLNQHEPATLKTGCAAVELLQFKDWTMLEPVIWSPELHLPIGGSWVSRFSLNRCGETVMRRLLQTANRRGGVLYAPLVPGDTLTNYTLEMRSRGAIIHAAKARFSRCTDPRQVVVINSQVTKPPTAQPTVSGTGGNGKSDGKTGDINRVQTAEWEELWTASACNQIIKLRLRFAPDRRDRREIAVTVVND